MPISVDRFIQALTKTGIITPAEAETLTTSVPAEKRAGDADDVARDLVRQGKLTRFQAAAIYQDKADGLLLGNYLILDKLGAGGMGQVFRARHRRMDRVVAIKVLSKKLLDSPDAVARFQREAKAAARLTHPNIVTAYDADEAGGMHFLVMEFVDGSDLAGIVKQKGPLPVGQALDYLLQAARGLEHAHGERVVHRDIKPSNLLLDKKGTLKILDMGLARMSDPLADPSAAPGADLTHSGSIMGTIDYMAPEQAMDSRQADARSDIYSLGCTLHYVLTGRPPYGGDTILKRLTAHQQAAVPLLSATRPDIPPGFDQVFGRMMAKRPHARFQTSKELVAALEALRNQPITARPTPVIAQPIAPQAVMAVPATPMPSGVRDLESIMLPGIEPGSRKARKPSSKMPLIAAAIVLLLAAAGVGAWMMSGHQPSEIAQSDSTPKVEVQTSDVVPPPTVTAESKPAVVPAPETMPVAASPVKPEPASPPPEVMPAKPEPPVSVVPQSPPVAAAPAVSDPPAPQIVAPMAAPPAAEALPSLPPDQPAADAKLPVPSPEARRESIKLIKELYKDEYAQAKQPEAKAALAEKMLNDVQQTKDDATALYCVLSEARDLAVEAANPALAERAIGMLAGRFAIEPLQELAAALEEMAGKPHPAEVNRPITEAALARVEEAQAMDDFETAKRLADVALAAARKSKDPALSKRAIEVGKAVAAAKQQWDAWQKAQATLKQTPDDPAANLAVGRYLCVVQGDWEQGLAALSKGPDGPLKDLAAKSLKPPADAAALADLADAWFAAAEKAKGKDKADLRAGAAYWYTQAEPGLTGLVKTVVEKRLKDLGGSVAARPNRTETPLANGLWLPQTFDCAIQAYPVTLGQNFNIQKSWTLALEFRPPSISPTGRQVFLFYWGDERNSRDPIVLKIVGDRLEIRLCDPFKDRDDAYSLIQKLSPDAAGAWQQVVVHYDAPTNEISLSLNGTVVASGRSTIVPAVDRPMPLYLGGFEDKPQRFTGPVRKVWLGNADKATPPNAQNPAVATGSASKLPETMELALAANVGMKLRLIPTGTFAMGTPGATAGPEFAHQVNITRPFYFGVTEVTQAQWQAVMGNNPSVFEGKLDHPVEKVSWNDCQQFLERCNQSAYARKFRFRLPTEAEWEYACRAGTTTSFYFGDDPGLLPQNAWCKDNSNATTHPVGQLKPNAWGLYDMCGNVFEWCSDWWTAEYYKESPADDPQGPPIGQNRAVRGGAFSNPFGPCRSAGRNYLIPETAAGPYGLRLVCEPKADSRVMAAGRGPVGSAKPAPRPSAAGGRRPMAFNQAEIERNVANWVLSVGGKVKVTSPATPEQNPQEINVATQLSAEPFLLYGVDLGDGLPVTEIDLIPIGNLANLVEFRFVGTSLGDKAAVQLARQPNLQRVDLGHGSITDAGLRAVGSLTRLRYLALSENKLVTDAGLAHLRGLSDLREIWLSGMAITAAGIKQLQNVPTLRTLGVPRTKIAEGDLKELAAFRTVSYFNIDGTPAATDASMAALRAMPSLAELHAGHSSVSDKGLETLATFPGLKKLHVTGSRVTDAGVQRFKSARPDCEVFR